MRRYAGWRAAGFARQYVRQQTDSWIGAAYETRIEVGVAFREHSRSLQPGVAGAGRGPGRPGSRPHVTTSERTDDGVWYRIRPIRLDDAARERDFICGLSEESRYQRLMYTVREPSAAFIDQMVSVDFRNSMAFVAVIGAGESEGIIGVARYANGADDSGCEFAIVVADLWQSRGVGGAIARRLIDHARGQGVLNLYARISATNSRMVAFAHRLGFTTRLTPGDSTLLSAGLALPTKST